jgi:NADPH-dependent glutamate synthase beta subunit-like oxidoreductase
MSEKELPADPLAEHGRTYAPHEAVVEASRCLMCDDPPCNKGCPAGVDARRFIRKIRFGNFRGAARLIREANLLVGVCGRVCPQEILCMEHCTRANLDTPIDIAGLQRFAGDVEIGTVAPVPDAPPRRKGKVAVIGAGPAGLAAAASLLRAGHEVEIFERGDVLGGVLSRGIPPFRLDPGFVESELEYVRRLGAVVHLEEHTKAPALLTAQGFDAVFVAVGLWKAHRLNIEGASLEGVLIAGDLLLAVARGERPAVGGRVVVIGGGNVAMDAATTALALGAARVDVCCLESYDEMPAFRSEIAEAQALGVELHTRTKPVRILGEGGRVSGYEGVGIRWKTPGLLVPSNAEEVAGTEFRLRADTVIVAIGQGILERFEGLATDERGLIRVDPETMMTSYPGIFAGGDIVSGGATVVRAVAEGKKAAESIARYLGEQPGAGGPLLPGGASARPPSPKRRASKGGERR